jgi:tetratricopeptide (TPR) repeat protein
LAVTLSHIGSVYADTGEPARALEPYQRARSLYEAVGDRAGERTTRYNIAMVYRMQGHLEEAVDELRQVVALDAQVHSPDLAVDRALLAQVQAELEQS